MREIHTPCVEFSRADAFVGRKFSFFKLKFKNCRLASALLKNFLELVLTVCGIRAESATCHPNKQK